MSTLAAATFLHAATAQRGFVNAPGSTKYAAISLFANSTSDLPAGVAVSIGTVTKHPGNPLLVQDKPWEPRLDNSYPNVVHAPKDPLGAYRLWYGGFIAGNHFNCSQGAHRVNAWHYANSSDGIVWSKPALGLFNLSKVPQCSAAAKAAGTQNNIIIGGDGTGIFRDDDDRDASRRFKAFGTLCPQGGSCVSGVATSADGLTWNDLTPVAWPAPQRYDCHQNVVRDPANGNGFVYTTRDGFSQGPGRTVGIATAKTPTSAYGVVDLTKAPAEVERGDSKGAHQLYAQVTFPFYNIWLGLVAVFDTALPSTFGHGTVHTRLSYSNAGPLGPWEWVDPDGLLGAPLIPNGDMKKKEFDDHIIFPAHIPFTVHPSPSSNASNSVVRVYYMGGNGPHNGARNTSLGLASLRADGFSGIAGTSASSFQTTSTVRVTGKYLRVSLDQKGGAAAAFSFKIGVRGVEGITVADCDGAEGGSGVTDAVVGYASGATFESLVGSSVLLDIQMAHAILYTISFTDTK